MPSGRSLRPGARGLRPVARGPGTWGPGPGASPGNFIFELSIQNVLSESEIFFSISELSKHFGIVWVKMHFYQRKSAVLVQNQSESIRNAPNPTGIWTKCKKSFQRSFPIKIVLQYFLSFSIICNPKVEAGIRFLLRYF